ncbi:hypothetical protein ZWY2020_052990 [Hordeum vulgare]|nr:hypothetical protein ZWY2020_052990 [Hordeum vulgare]
MQQLEQDVEMRLGYVTEEANKSSRRAAWALEQVDAAQAASAEAEAKLCRLRMRSDQWRKAAKVTAALAGGGNNGGLMVERTESLDTEYNGSIGGKLMGYVLTNKYFRAEGVCTNKKVHENVQPD